MDELNQWYYSQPEPQDELAYLHQQEQEARMQQQFAEPLPELQQYWTSPILLPLEPSRPHYSPSFPRSGDPALPDLSFGVVAEQGHAQQSSPSILSFRGHGSSTLTFWGGTWPDATEGMPQAPEKQSRAHLNPREHVMAERRRRDKMQQQFMALASIIPDLTKTDKITLLGSAIKYVKQLEDKLKTLQEQRARRISVSASSNSKYHLSTSNDASGSCLSAGESIPSVEASVHGNTILVKISCKEKRGVLVRIISELENQGMSIISTSVLPFAEM